MFVLVTFITTTGKNRPGYRKALVANRGTTVKNEASLREAQKTQRAEQQPVWKGMNNYRPNGPRPSMKMERT